MDFIPLVLTQCVPPEFTKEKLTLAVFSTDTGALVAAVVVVAASNFITVT